MLIVDDEKQFVYLRLLLGMMNPNFALCQEKEECKTQSQSQAQFQFQLQLNTNSITEDDDIQAKEHELYENSV